MAAQTSLPVKYITALRLNQRDVMRRRIRKAARNLFYEHHYDATTMDQIATAAGVRRSTLYLHYKDKADILTDIIEDYAPRARRFLASLPGPEPTYPRLRKWMTEVTIFVARERVPLFVILEIRQISRSHKSALERLTTELLAGLGNNNPPFRKAAQDDAAPALRARGLLLLRELMYACQLYLDDPSTEFASALLRVTAKDFHAFLSKRPA
jgi:AcrR family transcriptional regulator